jgi:uncharacterized membrane protein YqhA
MSKRNRLPFARRMERGWEVFLWATRFLVLIAIVSGLAASLMLFILGAREVWDSFGIFTSIFKGQAEPHASIRVLSATIGAIDTFLIAVVVLIFCFGLYELFISRIDPAQGSEGAGILKIHNLEALKDKIASVIIMALVMKFFQIVLTLPVENLLDSLLYAAGVVLLALAVLLLQLGQRLLAKLKSPIGDPTTAAAPQPVTKDGIETGPAK